jgi:hypothetical protein
LHCCISKGRLAVARFLVTELGADVDQLASDDITSLYIACELCSLASVRVLVKELNADVNKARGASRP